MPVKSAMLVYPGFYLIEITVPDGLTNGDYPIVANASDGTTSSLGVSHRGPVSTLAMQKPPASGCVPSRRLHPLTKFHRKNRGRKLAVVPDL